MSKKDKNIKGLINLMLIHKYYFVD